jgi:hypothetical protein
MTPSPDKIHALPDLRRSVTLLMEINAPLHPEASDLRDIW